MKRSLRLSRALALDSPTWGVWWRRIFGVRLWSRTVFCFRKRLCSGCSGWATGLLCSDCTDDLLEDAKEYPREDA